MNLVNVVRVRPWIRSECNILLAMQCLLRVVEVSRETFTLPLTAAHIVDPFLSLQQSRALNLTYELGKDIGDEPELRRTR